MPNGEQQEQGPSIGQEVASKVAKGLLKIAVLPQVLAGCGVGAIILFIIVIFVGAIALFFITGEEAPATPETPATGTSLDEFQKFLQDTTNQKALMTSGCDDPRNGGERAHGGYDFALEKDTKIYAAYPGTVVKVFGNDRWGGSGGAVWVQNTDKSFVTSYGHIYQIKVKVGDVVEKGTLLGVIAKDHLDVKRFKDPNQHWQDTVICPWLGEIYE